MLSSWKQQPGISRTSRNTCDEKGTHHLHYETRLRYRLRSVVLKVFPAPSPMQLDLQKARHHEKNPLFFREISLLIALAKEISIL